MNQDVEIVFQPDQAAIARDLAMKTSVMQSEKHRRKQVSGALEDNLNEAAIKSVFYFVFVFDVKAGNSDLLEEKPKYQ